MQKPIRSDFGYNRSKKWGYKGENSAKNKAKKSKVIDESIVAQWFVISGFIWIVLIVFLILLCI